MMGKEAEDNKVMIISVYRPDNHLKSRTKIQ